MNDPAPVNPNKALWATGDFTRIAERMRGSGEKLVGSLGIQPGMDVLDLGCGDGTTALPEAQLGANVVGIDLTPALVAAGQARAKAAGLDNIRFEEGDASNLSNLADDSFDLVVSIFGAMFAPRPDDVAKEMVRVTRRGGRIVMGNWIPGDPTLVAQILRLCSGYMPPPPPGSVSPMTWGVEDTVRERFDNAGIAPGDIEFERLPWRMHGPWPVDDLCDIFIDYYAPTMKAVEAAEAAGRSEELKRELHKLFREHNQGGEGTDLSPTFLKVTAHKR
jgi:SAM-dependent methyltransferase